MRNALLLLASALALSGCIDAQLTVNVMPDGSGNIDIDVGYDTRAWPSFLGDPLQTYTSHRQLRAWQSRGIIAWSEPELVREGRYRRIRTAMWFDSIGQVQFWATSKGQPLETLGIDWKGSEGRLDMRAGFVRFLDDPLPLPSPERVGMDVSLSPALLDAVRAQIRPVIEGLEVRLDVVMPGKVTRADGFHTLEGRRAKIRVDADRLAEAMRDRAGVIFEEESLKAEPPRILFEPQDVPEAETRALSEARLEALRWWNSGR